MNILIASSEAVPYVKTGGLADVAGSLLKELRIKRQNASLILPLYSAIRETIRPRKTGKTVRIPMGQFMFEGAIYASGKGKFPEAYFVECDQLFGRPELYGTSSAEYGDNAVRFIFFSRAVLEACIALDIHPDIIHCNDWQTGMIPLYLKAMYARQKQLRKTATLFTVHNLGYQGNYDAANMAFTGLGWDYFVPDRLEFYGSMSFLKSGLLYADLLNTVSKTYAREILEPENGFNMDGVLRLRKNDLYGIINGMDYREWDPQRDPYLPAGYHVRDLGGKALCRERLQRQAGFKNRKAPILSIVSRLTSQKGLDIALHAMEEIVALGANVLVLGKGEEYYQGAYSAMAERHRGRVYVHIGFEEPFARLVYAGSDFFLMPSRYEPCGIGQLAAMRYGTIPVARKTGGLADTIDDYDHLAEQGTGFLFSEYSPLALIGALKRAFCMYTDPRKMKSLVMQAMKKDFSWSSAALAYQELYRKAMQKQ